MSYGDFYFIRAEKPFIHPQKRGRIPMRFDLFIYSAKLKFLFRSLFNRFFNALAGSTFFHALDS
jgi:hypothetical protein